MQFAITARKNRANQVCPTCQARSLTIEPGTQPGALLVCPYLHCPVLVGPNMEPLALSGHDLLKLEQSARKTLAQLQELATAPAWGVA